MTLVRPTSLPLLIAPVALCALLLSGCASGTVVRSAASATPSSSAAPAGEGKPATAAGAPIDAGIAATCAGVSVISTTVHNARHDLDAGAINADQYVALIEAAYTGYRSVETGPKSQRGLRPELQAVMAYIEANPDSTTGARFDPYAKGYGDALYPLLKACEANVSETYVFATSGG